MIGGKTILHKSCSPSLALDSSTVFNRESMYFAIQYINRNTIAIIGTIQSSSSCFERPLWCIDGELDVVVVVVVSV